MRKMTSLIGMYGTDRSKSRIEIRVLRKRVDFKKIISDYESQSESQGNHCSSVTNGMLSDSVNDERLLMLKLLMLTRIDCN